MPEDSASTKPAETRRLAAIMFTDIVGFSRQMGADEARMLRLLEVHNQIIQRAVAEHHGTVIKTIGDAFLVDFPSVVHAVQCAQYIQAQLRTHNRSRESAEQIHVRIGIHLGDIVQKNGDVFGDGVNIAARLQAVAEPDTVCISQVVYQEVSKKLDLGAAEVLSRVGRVEEAVGIVEQALRRKPFVADQHLESVSLAYYLAGRPEEAISPLKQYLVRYPNHLGTHLTLTAVYSALGKVAEARVEAAEVLRLNPKFSLEVHKERAPIKDPAILERHIAALRKAGLK